MLLKRQIASALPPQITGLHGTDHCRHLGVIFKAFQKRISGVVGAAVSATTGPTFK